MVRDDVGLCRLLPQCVMVRTKFFKKHFFKKYMFSFFKKRKIKNINIFFVTFFS